MVEQCTTVQQDEDQQKIQGTAHFSLTHTHTHYDDDDDGSAVGCGGNDDVFFRSRFQQRHSQGGILPR